LQYLRKAVFIFCIANAFTHNCRIAKPEGRGIFPLMFYHNLLYFRIAVYIIVNMQVINAVGQIRHVELKIKKHLFISLQFFRD